MGGNEVVNRIIMEELTKSDVASMISSKFDTKMKSSEFDKKVKEIAGAVMKEFFRTLYQKDSLWKSSIR